MVQEPLGISRRVLLGVCARLARSHHDCLSNAARFVLRAAFFVLIGLADQKKRGKTDRYTLSAIRYYILSMANTINKVFRKGQTKKERTRKGQGQEGLEVSRVATATSPGVTKMTKRLGQI